MTVGLAVLRGIRLGLSFVNASPRDASPVAMTLLIEQTRLSLTL